MFTQLEIRLIAIVAALLLIFAGVLYLEHRGAQKCEASDAQVAAIQKSAAKVQEASDAQRIKDAEDALAKELIANAAHTEPVSHVVCFAPSGPSVPPAAKVPASHPAPARLLPAAGTPSFDPGPALDQLHAAADDIVARCRELDAAVPH